MSHTHGHGPATAADWDARYADTGLVWGAGPNALVAEYIGDLAPTRAVDIACGEGRNAIYLARRGWQVAGVDFSHVAIDKAARLERAAGTDHDGVPVTWICADATTFRPDPMELALIVYAHLPADDRRTVLRHVIAALVSGGRLLVIGHNTRNIAEGTGGPQDPSILYTATDILDDLGHIAPAMLVEIAAEPLRHVDGAKRVAIDTVVLARRPE